MPIIIIITIAIYIVLIAWTWKNLGSIENTKKIGFIICSLAILFIITTIVFSMSKTNIIYPSKEIEEAVRNVLVTVFAGLNGMIVMPYLGKMLEKVKENEIKKEEFLRKLIIIGSVFVICIFFECGYLKDTQEGILQIYQKAAN